MGIEAGPFFSRVLEFSWALDRCWLVFPHPEDPLARYQVGGTTALDIPSPHHRSLSYHFSSSSPAPLPIFGGTKQAWPVTLASAAEKLESERYKGEVPVHAPEEVSVPVSEALI